MQPVMHSRLDPSLEAEARTNLTIALLADLQHTMANREEECIRERRQFSAELDALKLHCEVLQGTVGELNEKYNRLWNSRSRLLRRGFKLALGFAAADE